MLQRRARFILAIRQFFYGQGVLEVETPLMCGSTATDPHLDSIEVSYHAAPGCPAERRYLQTSPEYAMKRLLAAGSGPIFQIGRAFRDGERGRRHNPEFTMLEWYRPAFTLDNLMAEVASLVQTVANISVAERMTYREAFRCYAGLDPFTDDIRLLRARAGELTGFEDGSLARDDALDIILSHQIEPNLGLKGGTFIYQYPPSQAALAQTTLEGDQWVAQRFELYVQGIEIANGYYELTDAAEQSRRLAEDNRRRVASGKAEIPVDERFLSALRAGLPDCAGVALGVDRLLMVATGAERIDEVVAFPVDRI